MHSPKLLICDDLKVIRTVIKRMFKDTGYQITEASNGREVLELLETQEFDVLLLDIVMPDLDGLEVCKHIRSDPRLLLLPIILITSLNQPGDIAVGMDLGATDYVTKPFNKVELRARVEAALERKHLTDHLDDVQSVLFTLARMVEARDRTTGDHCDRLAHMGVVFGKELQLDRSQLDGLRRGGVLHDIGKLGIPDKILLKKGKLDTDEWLAMKQHTIIGAELCSPLRTMREAHDIVKYHHERQDGSGYPYGLQGDKIPLLARIFQIVDIYDALASERPYKMAYSVANVIEIMEGETAAGWWDPDLMQVFLSIVREKREVLELPEKPPWDRSAEIFNSIAAAGTIELYQDEI